MFRLATKRAFSLTSLFFSLFFLSSDPSACFLFALSRHDESVTGIVLGASETEMKLESQREVWNEKQKKKYSS